MKTLIIALLFSIPQIATAQWLEIKGEPIIGGVLIAVANVEITLDDKNRPSHTVEFLGDDPLIQLGIQVTPIMFALPTGCNVKSFTLNLRITDWESHQITNESKTIQINPPGSITPPPVGTLASLESLARREFEKIADPVTAKILADNWAIAIEAFPADLTTAKQMWSDSREVSFNANPVKLKHWKAAFVKIKKEINKLNPKTVDEFRKILEILIVSLNVE